MRGYDHIIDDSGDVDGDVSDCSIVEDFDESTHLTTNQ